MCSLCSTPRKTLVVQVWQIHPTLHVRTWEMWWDLTGLYSQIYLLLLWKFFLFKFFFSWYRCSSLLLNDRSEKRFSSSWKYVVWSGAVEMFYYQLLFLLKYIFATNKFFSSMTIFLSWFPCAVFLMTIEPFSSFISYTPFPNQTDTVIFLSERALWKN